MRHAQRDDDWYIDADGCLTEREVIGGLDVIVHYADLPDSDDTAVNGIACTTALRTVIDIASETDPPDLERIVRHCLERKLFSVDEAATRTAQPDMVTHPGAQLLRRALPR